MSEQNDSKKNNDFLKFSIYIINDNLNPLPAYLTIPSLSLPSLALLKGLASPLEKAANITCIFITERVTHKY